jgi:hypothetical protein
LQKANKKRREEVEMRKGRRGFRGVGTEFETSSRASGEQGRNSTDFSPFYLLISLFSTFSFLFFSPCSLIIDYIVYRRLL